MNTKRTRRLIFIIVLLLGLSSIVGLVLYALRQNINLFFTPTQIQEGQAPIGPRIRVGGMVEEGSLKRKTGLDIQFSITDYQHSLTILYTGILPDLFREKQGVVALGHLIPPNIFVADEVLAKHDEKYMPPEINHLGKKKP